MNKKVISAIALCLVLMICFAGCNRTEPDPEPEIVYTEEEKFAMSVAATINGTEITRGELDELLIERIRSQYGPDAEAYIEYLGEANLTEYRIQILDTIIKQKAAKAEAIKLGLYNLDEEATAEFEEFYNGNIEYHKQYFTNILKNEDLENGILETLIETKDYSAAANERMLKYFEENLKYTLTKYEGDDTMAKYKNYLLDNFVITKLLEEVTKDITIEEAAIQEEYDRLMTEQKESFKDITKYEEMYNTNIDYRLQGGIDYDFNTIVYVPEGERFVKHILIMYPTETGTKLSELYSAMDDDKYYMDEAKTALDSETDETKKVEAQTDYDTAKSDYEASKKAYDDAVIEAKATIADKVNDITAKINAGEDFNALIDEFGEDPGMANEPYKSDGYMVSAKTTSYDEDFTVGSMALTKVGEISKPVYTSFGAHFIKYESDVKAGEIPYDEVKENISKILKEEAMSKRITELVDKWVADSTVEKFDEVIKAAPLPKETNP